jgi:cation diffusion facilitator CzcD-associated flavoprotein CzcO
LRREVAIGANRGDGKLETKVGRKVAADVCDAWIQTLGATIESREPEAFGQLFLPEGFWRDILSFTWERPTFSGRAQIRDAFGATVESVGARNFRRAARRSKPRFARRSGRRVLEAWFDFDTDVGSGAGFVRLLHNEDDPHNPKIWLLLTTLHSLKGFEDKVEAARPTGNEYSKILSSENWKQRREQEQVFLNRDPAVLIVGAGHSGLMLAARLRQMGVDVLVVERNGRVGDNWRRRYNNLTLHNEINGNHFPYLTFPATWPVWLPKDMLAAWLEAYAEFLELNVWTDTTVAGATFNATAKEWQVTLRRGNGTERVLRCKHLVAAVGVSGGVPKRPTIAGLSDFRGSVLHSSEFDSGTIWRGKRALVIGTGNSGHDVAQDLYVSGAASVSILQRGATVVLSLEPSAKISYSIYRDDLPVEDVDLMVAAIPYPLLIDSYQWITRRTTELDRELLAKLDAAGFKTHLGEDQTGFQLQYLRGAGGYYINVGCADLIIDKKIGLVQFEDADRFVAEGLRMKDGSLVPFDLVVLATGFQNMQESIRAMLGDKIADRVGPVWGFDEDYNMRNIWKRTGQEGFWVMGGAILEARLNSRFLALEIKASLEGLIPQSISREKRFVAA